MTETKPKNIDELLGRMVEGEPVDWKGSSVPAEKLKARLFASSHGDQPPTIVLLNAKVDGDLLLDEIGECSAPLSLQILGCKMGTFRARASRWRQLVIAKTVIEAVDLPQIRVDRSLVIEECKVKTWLELRESRVGGTLALNGSSFAEIDGREAVVMNNAIVDSDFDARDLKVRGSIKASRIVVGGNVKLDGANLDDRRLTDTPVALDLSRARVGGMLQFAPGKGRFVARGRIHIDAAELGGMAIKAAMLDGCGQPAIVGDQVQIRETLDITGLSGREQGPLEVNGALRFGSSVIGRQIQLSDAILKGAGELLILHNCRVGGDIVIGQPGVATLFHGTLNADLCELEGRLVLEHLTFEGLEAGVNARQARVTKEISCFAINAEGPIRLDNSEANGLSLENVELSRAALPAVREGLPKPYSQPEDVLLELLHLQLRADLRIENVSIVNGNVRLGEAQVGGTLQFSRVCISAGNRLALILQGARIGGSLILGGTPDRPAPIDGEISLMGAHIGGDATFAHMQLGTAAATTTLNMRNAVIASGVHFHECDLHGQVVASAARIGGDFFFHSTRLLRPGDCNCDLRGARVEGKLQWATTWRAEGEIACVIDGRAICDGATVGSLGWNGVELRDGTALILTNMHIERRIDAENLIASEKSQINLSGTTTPLLVDHFGDRDSWGRAWIGLDNFSYSQLANPSGGNSDEAGEIMRRRNAWLDRRFDPTSARPARHLASVLRQQGLFEASRRTLKRAFGEEGAARPTWLGRAIAHYFGLLFGHGLSGSRAAFFIVWIWFIGVCGTIDLKQKDLFVAPAATQLPASCAKLIDPLIYPLDVMIPLDFGEESRCVIGAGKKAELYKGYEFGNATILATLPTANTLAVLYKLFAWISLSLAIATWSGLFKRAGRE